MANIQLFAQKQGETGFSSYYELDLYKEEPIKITKNVEDVDDPQKNASNFSRTFRVPNTSVNGQFFKAVFNVNAIDFDATQKADAYINVNGTYFMSGNIRITQIYRNDSQGKIEYEIIFMGETSTFASIVGPKDLSDLNLNEYAHTITYSQIQNSWNGTLFNGDVVYPLAEWGYTYTSGVPDQSTLAFYQLPISQKGFTNSANPLSLRQFKPAIRAKAVWDKIFEEAGFTYESTFLDNNIFGNLYLISSNDALPTQNEASNFEAANTFQDIAPLAGPGAQIQMEFNTTFSNTGNDFYESTNKYIAPFTGAGYTFEVEAQLGLKPIPQGITYLTLTLQVNGTQVQQRTVTFDPTPCAYLPPNGICQTDLLYQGFYTVIPFSVPLNAGDEVTVHFVKPSGYTILYLENTFFRGTSPNVVTPTGLMPANYKQIDFLKGINDKFKLIWEPDPLNPKKFYIEPWKDWVAQGAQKDWTAKLNENKDISIKPRFYTQPRQLVFKDSNESDLYNFSYEQEYKEVFGELKQDSDIELITGSKDIKTIFAPVPLAPIGNSSQFLIPHFAKDTEDERQPIQVKPRLMYYNGLQNAPYTWYMRNDGGTSVAQTQYPVFSQFDRYPFDEQAFDFNWTNNVQYWNLTNVGTSVGSGRTGRDAFGEFWSKWYDDAFSPYSRVLEASFVLDLEDVSEIRFKDLIFVKDAWYQPIKISDYVLGDKAEVRCQLLKLGAVGVNINPGPTGPGSGPKVYTFPDLCWDPGNECNAYCCTNKTKFTIYSSEPTLNSSSQWYMDPGLTVAALTGWYYDGAFTYYIAGGQLLQVGTGASCSCNPPVVFTKACTSASFCTACCCDTFLTDIYYNGVSLEASTLAYSSGAYAPLIPGNWYKENGGTAVVQMGSDGITIVQVGNCGSCICDVLVDSDLTGTGNAESPNGATGSCCGSGATGSFGLQDVYFEGPSWGGATGYYFDPIKNQPVGGTGSMYISDGKQWKYTTAAVPGVTGACPDPQGSGVCPDRTALVDTNMENPSPTNIELVLTYETSPDGSNWYYNGQDTAVGNTFNNAYTPYWNPSSYWRMEMDVPVPSGTIDYNIYKNAVLIHSATGITSFPFYTPEYGPIGTDNYSIDFNWNP